MGDLLFQKRVKLIIISLELKVDKIKSKENSGFLRIPGGTNKLHIQGLKYEIIPYGQILSWFNGKIFQLNVNSQINAYILLVFSFKICSLTQNVG